MAAKFTSAQWTTEETKILREKYPVCKTVDISPLVPCHTKTAIRIKARRLGLRQLNPHTHQVSAAMRQRLSDFRKEYSQTHDAPFKGKRHTLATRDLLRQATIEQFSNPESRNYISEMMVKYYSDPVHRENVGKRQAKFFSDPANREAASKSSKERFNDPAFLVKYRSFLKKPNKLEQRVLAVIDNLGLPFKYNGDYSQGIALNCKIPDFINTNGKKQVIEVFGDYWHRHPDGPKFNYLNENKQIASYKAVGFECLVLWEHDIRKMTDEEIGNRIKSFSQEVEILLETCPRYITMA